MFAGRRAAVLGRLAGKAAEDLKKDDLPVLFLPGVSLVFTGIAAATLSGIDPALATIVQGTIVAAAIINEVIAVIIAKFAFQWAGEIAK